MELIRISRANVNITSETELLSYTYTGDRPIEVIARVDLGDLSGPIAGGATYVMRLYIDNVLMTPDVGVPVPNGATRTIMASRPAPLVKNNVISVRAIGTIADTSVNTVVSLRDDTPIVISDVLGTGTIPVDHDYGGIDNLTYKTAEDVGVADANILVYRLADYDAGNRSENFLVGKSTTVSGGKWSHPVYLYPDDYTIIAVKFGEFGPDRKDITVIPSL